MNNSPKQRRFMPILTTNRLRLNKVEQSTRFESDVRLLNACFSGLGFLLVAYFCLSVGLSAQDMFVVSDIYSIRPDGTIQELRSTHLNQLKTKNIHWDTASQTLYLFAARNEEVAVQVVVADSGNAYTFTAGELAGPQMIGTERQSFSLVAWANHTDTGPSADVVVPLDGSIAGLTSFDVPYSLPGFPDIDTELGIALYEVWVPKSAPTGTYQGQITVQRGQSAAVQISVELKVLDLELPDMPSFQFELLAYGLPSRVYGHRQYINNPGLGNYANKLAPEAKRIDYQALQLVLDNRCFINILPYQSQRGRPRYAYPVAGPGHTARISSYVEWEDFFEPYLSGKLSKFGTPPAHFLLPFNINYPYTCETNPEQQFDFLPYKSTIPDSSTQNPSLGLFETSYKRIAAQYLARFAEKGWHQTIFEVYNNQKPNLNRNRTPWKLDEPVAAADYRGLGYLFNLSRDAFSSADSLGIRVANRIDIGHFNCDRFLTPSGATTRCYKAKAYNTADADNKLKGRVDHWVIGSDHVEGAQHTLVEYKSEKTRLLNYSTSGSGNSLDGHFALFAGEGFRAARMGLDGRVIFRMGLNDGNISAVEPGGGNSTCLYKSNIPGFEGVFASRRLKLWRRAVNDFEYIRIAQEQNEAETSAIVQQMAWPGPARDVKFREKSNARGFVLNNSVADYMRARLMLAAIIQNQPHTLQLGTDRDKYYPCRASDQIEGYD